MNISVHYATTPTGIKVHWPMWDATGGLNGLVVGGIATGKTTTLETLAQGARALGAAVVHTNPMVYTDQWHGISSLTPEQVLDGDLDRYRPRGGGPLALIAEDLDLMPDIEHRLQGWLRLLEDPQVAVIGSATYSLNWNPFVRDTLAATNVLALGAMNPSINILEIRGVSRRAHRTGLLQFSRTPGAGYAVHTPGEDATPVQVQVHYNKKETPA